MTYALLMPARNTVSEDAFIFQTNMLRSGIIGLCLSMLTRNNFMPNADISTKR